MMASGDRRTNRPDIRAQLTGSFVNADRRFIAHRYELEVEI
jgi:hypothetical protein